MPEFINQGLTEDQVESFITDGFVRVEEAFPAELPAECRAALWSEIGLSPDRPEG